MSGPCAKCRHWSDAGVTPALRVGGWGHCAYLKHFNVTSSRAACSFTESRFEARSEAVPTEAVDNFEPVDNFADHRVQPAPCDLPEEIDFG